MKRFLVLFVLLALAMALVIALPAGAVRPQCDETLEDYTPKHPICNKDEPPDEPSVGEPCDTITTLSGSTIMQLKCDWTPQNTEAPFGTVRAKVTSGEVSRINLWVRDSDPGDICVLNEGVPNEGETADGTVFEASFPLVDEDGTYWDSMINWCGERSDLNGDPLHVWVYIRAKRGTVVEVSLIPGQAE